MKKISIYLTFALAAGIGFTSAFAAGAPIRGDAKIDYLYPFANSTYPRNATATAYDSVRKRVVVFGGVSSSTAPDTIEWDGGQWIGLHTDPHPSLAYYTMAYDAAHGVCVLYGSAPGRVETWTWDGSAWKKLAVPGPTERTGQLMDFDSANNVVVLFGGKAPDGTFLSDTWSWNGSAWSQMSTPTSPDPRTAYGMVFDSNRGVNVLFGGIGPKVPYMGFPNILVDTLYTDTWELSGSTWTKKVLATTPDGMGPLAYDSVRKVVVNLGAYTNSNRSVFEYAGADWKKIAPSGGPASINYLGAAFDAAIGTVTVVGPSSSYVNGNLDTWEWNGAAWTSKLFLPTTSLFKWKDMNGDGRPDLIISGVYGGKNVVALFMNNGNGIDGVPAWIYTIGTQSQANTAWSADWGDIDGSGYPALAIGTIGGTVMYFSNTHGKLSAAPAWSATGSYFNPTWVRMTSGSATLDLAVRISTGVNVFRYSAGIGKLEAAPSISYLVPNTSDGKAGTTVSMAWADIDGDGDSDLALEVSYPSGSTAEGTSISIVQNNAGTLSQVNLLRNYSGPFTFGDIDRDGLPDLVGGTYAFLNTAGAFTQPSWQIPNPDGIANNFILAQGVSLGDADGDGDLDLLVSYGTNHSYYLLYHNEGGGKFTSTPVWRSFNNYLGYEYAPPFADLIDFDGDGYADAATYQGVYLLAPPYYGATVPSPPANLNAYSGIPRNQDITVKWTASTSADVAKYRIYVESWLLEPELLAEVPATQTSFVHTPSPGGFRRYSISAVNTLGHESDPTGNAFEIASLLPTNVVGDAAPDATFGHNSSWNNPPLVGDLDGDGKPDIFLFHGLHWQIFHNDGTGHFNESWTHDYPAYLQCLSLGDVNNDGLPDLIAVETRTMDLGGGVTDELQVLELYLNTGGSFASTPAWSYVLPKGSNVTAGSDCTAWGDVDGSGHKALAVANAGVHGEVLLFSNIGGTLSASPVWTSTEQTTTTVAFGQYDSDSLDDLAFSQTAGISYKAYVYTGKAGGLLGTTPSWSHSPGSNSGPVLHLSWFDFNKDGKQDLTVHAYNAAYLYANSGGNLGTTTLNEYFGTGSGADGTIGWADLNGDGLPDLYGKSSILPGGINGTGGAIAKASGPIANQSSWIVGTYNLIDQRWQMPYGALLMRAVDFNGDGIPDWLVTSNGTVEIYFRTTSLTPTAVPNLPSKLTVTPSVVQLNDANPTATLTAIVTYADNSTEDVTDRTIFYSSNPTYSDPIISTFGNTVQGMASGTATVIAFYGESATTVVRASATVYVDVLHPAPVQLIIAPANAVLARIGEPITYTVSAQLSDGTFVDVTTQSTLSIAGNSAAVLGASGTTVVSTGNGTATVTASYAGLTVATSLTVNSTATLDSIAITPGSPTLKLGDSIGLSITAHYTDGSTLPVTPYSSISTLDNTILSVTGARVMALAPGQGTVTGTYLGLTASTVVSVTPDSVFQFSPAAYYVLRATGTASLIVNRIGSTAASATVDYATLDGSAHAGTDFTLSSGTLSFAVGQAQSTITVTLNTAIAASGNAEFWVQLGNATGGTRLGPITSAQVTLQPANPTLTVATTGSGTGTVSLNPPGGTYTPGTIVTLTASASPGSVFTGWSDDLSGSTNPATLTLDGNKSVTAAFSIIPPQYTLTVNSGSGSGSYTAGTQVQISAFLPPASKIFDKWVGDTSALASATSSTTTATMPGANITVTATYKDAPPPTYLLTVTNGTGGGSYTAGTQVPISANAPAAGKLFDHWTGDTSALASATASTTTVTMPNAPVNVTATYKNAPPPTYLLTVNSGSGSGTYTVGTQVAITANVPSAGNLFDKWTGAVSTVASVTSASTTVTMPAANATLTATYKPIPNLPPVFLSAPTALPNPAKPGDVVQFATQASDPENDILTYNWTFGDGATATGASVPHIYTSEGIYTATVTVSDGSHTISSSIAVKVASSHGLILSKLNGTANLAVSGKDICSFTGTLALPTNYNPTGISLTVNVGGAQATFVMDRSGNARTADGTVALKIPTGRNSASQSATLKITLKPGNWSNAWKSEWLQSALNQNATTAIFAVDAIIEGTTYSTTATVGLSVKPGKVAKFKLIAN